MTDLIKIQLKLVPIIILLLAIFLRRGMLQRTFGLVGLDLDEADFMPVKIVFICVICWLTWICFRDIWVALR